MTILEVYRRVLGLLAPEKARVIALVVGNVAIAGMQFVEPILLGKVVDALSQGVGDAESRWPRLLELLGLWGAVGVITIGATILVALHADRLAHKRRLAAMASYFEHVLQLSFAFYSEAQTGRLLKVLVEGTGNLFMLWLDFFREHCSTIVALFVLLPLSLVLNWRLGLLLVVLLAIFAVMTFFVVRRTEGLQRQVEDYHAQVAARAGDALGNVLLIQSFVRLEAEISTLKNLMGRLLAAQFPVLNWWALVTVLTRMASTIAVIGIFLMGAWLNVRHETTVGEIVTFMGIAGMLIGRLEGTMGFVGRMMFQVQSIRQFLEILDTGQTVVEKPGAAELPRSRGHVVFDEVVFSYDGKRPALKGLAFEAKPGMTVALVGTTGSGKSTTLAMLYRLFDPQGGRVMIDGTDVRDVTLASLRKNIGVVFQDNALFNRTVAENLRVGKPEATDEELVRAAKLAQAHEFIMAGDKGYDSVVGERGVKLSGGERQRLAIARALLKDPPILILDEATSALDSQTEAKVQEALAVLKKGRTTFLIAHRLSTVRDADLVLVLQRGEVIERGSYAELIAKDGPFARLVATQLAGNAVHAQAATAASA
ncbi:MAG: glucan ABC transporter ATP-binding protein/ permease [Alphaproteobacteria bacterium]|nr:glucan ABC transporter ATP-binding protein/ permease [Alphaproteobacteria bacterium]